MLSLHSFSFLRNSIIFDTCKAVEVMASYPSKRAESKFNCSIFELLFFGKFKNLIFACEENLRQVVDAFVVKEDEQSDFNFHDEFLSLTHQFHQEVVRISFAQTETIHNLLCNFSGVFYFSSRRTGKRCCTYLPCARD